MKKVAIADFGFGFVGRWKEILREQNHDFLEVDFFSNDLLVDLEKSRVEVFLTHIPMDNEAIKKFAISIIKSIEIMGIKAFPSSADVLHFDDKVAQKYIFDALKIPSPKTDVFFDSGVARRSLKHGVYPMVFKLRSGAGSVNVKKIRSYNESRRLISTMFSGGMRSTHAMLSDMQHKVRLHKRNKSVLDVISRLPRIFEIWARNFFRVQKERDYFYCQEMLADNLFDIRVTVVGEKAFVFRRWNRDDDFRASGSGYIDYEYHELFPKCIGLAFEASRKLGAVCMAYDYLLDTTGEPVCIEMSFGFQSEAVYKCGGFWNTKIEWHEGALWPEQAILEALGLIK